MKDIFAERPSKLDSVLSALEHLRKVDSDLRQARSQTFSTDVEILNEHIVTVDKLGQSLAAYRDRLAGITRDWRKM